MLMSKWQWLWYQFSKKLWVRTSLFCLIAVMTALAALLFKSYIPEDFSRQIGADSVDRILQIIASSMLAVTIFSLNTMVAAFTAATSNVTPRSTQLLLQDNTTQTALSVFLGSFLYSLVGIIALTMGIYGDSGRLILFVVTIVVIVIIVTVLIRWINYLTLLGRVSQTTDMIENETRKAISNRLRTPYLGANPLVDFKPGPSHFAVVSEEVGYVQHIDLGMLSELAEKEEILIYVQRLPGSFNDGAYPLVYTSKSLDEDGVRKINTAFTIGGDRSFEQDPRFGLIVLSEIASRALSPAMNDPGTAIDIIGTAVRLLGPWIKAATEDSEVKHKRVYVPSIQTSDLLDDIFSPIARDGAHLIEVGLRLQKAFKALDAISNPDIQKQVRKHADLALKRALASLQLQEDKELLQRVALK